jgi:hypothetical protein
MGNMAIALSNMSNRQLVELMQTVQNIDRLALEDISLIISMLLQENNSTG